MQRHRLREQDASVLRTRARMAEVQHKVFVQTSLQVPRMSHDHGPAQEKEGDKEHHRQQHGRPPTSF